MYTDCFPGPVIRPDFLGERVQQTRIKHYGEANHSLDLTNRKAMSKNDQETNPLQMSLHAPRASNSGDDGDQRIDHDSGFAAISEKPKLQKPPLYKVVLINDDYTPMDFVVEVLCSFFSMNVEKATQIMLKVHTEGKGVCGVFGKDVAESKAAQVNEYARECEQPLLCSVEVDR